MSLRPRCLRLAKSLTINELSQLFEDSDRPTANGIRAAIDSLAGEFADRVDRDQGNRRRLSCTGAPRQYSQAVSRLWPERPQRYSRALLETWR
jgi:hypothetical protein